MVDMAKNLAFSGGGIQGRTI